MSRSTLVAALVLALLANFADAGAAGYRAITEEVVAETDALSAWKLWTTNEGFKSFFPWATDEEFDTNIELRPGGPYEVFFLKDPPGERGCDSCWILAYQEGRMLSFTWRNRPGTAVRPHYTHVVVTFEPLGEDRTRVVLVADGWGDGPEWDSAYEFFSAAWARTLQSFKTRIEEGVRPTE